MSEVKARFLGTGTSQGVPVIACKCEVCQSSDSRDKRFRSSLLISIDKFNIVFDTGPDFRLQMLQNKVDNLDAVFYTHAHKDHIAGMDDIRAYNYQSKSAMEIFATDSVVESLKREFHYVFSGDKYPGIPEVNLNPLGDEPVEIFGETIIPINVMHYKLPVKAFRIRNFTYITDANFVSEDEIEKIKGTEILVINALRKEKHISHFNLKEALDFIAEIQPKKAYLTHISHLMGRHELVSRELPENVEIAVDGLEIDIS